MRIGEAERVERRLLCGGFGDIAASRGVFYGTGDLFASALSALLVRGLDAGRALELATQLVADSIAISAQSSAPRRFGVAFEQALPAYMARVQAAFGSGTSG